MGDRCKGLIEIDAIELGESLGRKVCMIFENFLTSVTFDAEYPSATYNVCILQLINLVPNSVLSHQCQLFVHSLLLI